MKDAEECTEMSVDQRTVLSELRPALSHKINKVRLTEIVLVCPPTVMFQLPSLKSDGPPPASEAVSAPSLVRVRVPDRKESSCCVHRS